MKINIGPYLNYWGPYQIADLLQYVGVSEDRCEKIGDWLAKTPLNDLCQWIMKKRKRREKIHIDNYDVWSMNYTLASIIYPMLLKLKEQKHGYPYTDASDGPVDFVSDEGPEVWDKGYSEKRWNYILDEMIWAFESLVNEDKYEDTYYQNDTWDMEGWIAHIDRQKNGLRLFGKYYYSLWD